MITPHECAAILAQVDRRTLAPQAAIAQLVAGGADPADAHELVFIALGGSDLVTTNAAGQPCYSGTGKTVAEVDAEMLNADS